MAAEYPQVECFGPVTFVRSFSDAQKRYLLESCTAVVYTPSNEHFGIVPIEAMAACRPVVAVSSGGPLESVVDGETGFLRVAEPEVRIIQRRTAVSEGRQRHYIRSLDFGIIVCRMG